ncbi:hypothetical protein KVF89_29515 [Nocardioides carbamazepini]|uniref:hypothetical protein n=1 Tax=Nocardioides carbamazepini TaxID=2854259 RepID=UPI00214A5BEA|nr:hypothetical protein [Nocardioides carbamazepini]MCR1786711.1 hypothetical protein [Nocardioides carbamazepini]
MTVTAETAAPARVERWILPKLLTRTEVEKWLAELPLDLDEVIFHISGDGCRPGPGGTESLQSAICLLHRRGVRTKLSFPPTTFSDRSRVEALSTAESESAGTQAERTLAYRLPGLVLAQLCEPADANSAAVMVKERQIVTVETNKHLFGHGTSRAIAVIGANDHRTHLRANAQDRQNQLESRILRMLGTENYHPARDNPLMEELVEFVYQATENTFDHGRKTFDGHTIQQVRLAGFSRHIVGTGVNAVALERHFPDPSSHLHEYVKRAQKRFAHEGHDPKRFHLWSVSVADGGVGIAAKMHKGLDIFDRDLAEEFKAVQDGVLPDGTTKPMGQPGRGRGLVKMMRATQRLGGFFEIRTGRLSLWRTYLNEDGSSEENLDFDHPASPAFTLRGENEAHVGVAGTVVSVLFPAFDLGPNSRPARGRG